MKYYYVIALCFLILAIFFGVKEGSHDFWANPSHLDSRDHHPQQGLWSGQPESEDAEMSRRLTGSKPRQRSRKTVTESGLVYTVLEQGKGEHPKPNSQVKVHYVGTLQDGTVFDSSRERGTPAVFPLDGLIPGFSEGLQLMKPGARYLMVIPAHLAYGDVERSLIPANSTLTFEVELLSIDKP